MQKGRLILITLLVFILGCGKKHIRTSYRISTIILISSKKYKKKKVIIRGRRYYPTGFVQRGIASWYGRKFHGKRTASGEIYNMYDRTAAHRTLPFGTYVLVRNLLNGRKTIVRINDRGPFVKGRIIDLSYRAAKDIGMIRRGTAPVELIVLGREIGVAGKKRIIEVSPIRRGRFGVQVGAFKNRKNAIRLLSRLSVMFRHVEIHVERNIYKVIVSGARTIKEANILERRLRGIGFKNTIIVSL